MTLPLTTTVVTIENLLDGSTPYEGDQFDAPVTVDAVVSNLTGSARYSGGNGQLITAVLHIDAGTFVGLGARVIDQTNEAVYYVGDVNERYELGLGYVRAGLYRLDGRGR